MNITKSFFSVFLATFLIGYVTVLTTTISSLPVNLEVTYKQAKAESNFLQGFPPLKIEPELKPEIFDVSDISEEETPKFKIKLIDVLETGNSYRKNEVIAKSGEKWLGLFRENDEYNLRYTKVRVVRDHSQNSGSDVNIKVNNKIEPRFLLKNADKLIEGKVKTLYNHPTYEEAEKLGIEPPLLNKGFVQEFQLGKRNYTLRVKEGLTKSNEKILALTLEHGKKSQIIHFIHYFELGDYVGNLLWVGDLDRDGKLDLYMEDYNYEKGSYSSGLYLSSEAEKGRLVELVAAFGTLGC